VGHDFGSVSRRTFVAGAAAAFAAAALGGCQGPRWYPSEISPDEYVLRGAIAEKERMIARYEATVAAGEGPSDLLERLLGDHRTHLEALRSRLPDDAGDEPRAAEDSPGPSPEPVPGDPVPTEGLRVAEDGAAGARVRQAGRVADPSLAQLLAAIGASEAGHAHQLAEAK
jgi:hypothetical protein